MTRQIQEIYDALAPEYDSRYRGVRHFVEDEIIAEFIAQMYSGGNVLDVGCGTGHLISVGQFDPDRYIGIDVSAGMLNVARRNYPDYFFKQHNALEPIPDQYDMVLAVFGQVNYMGVHAWAKILEQNLADDGKFLAVMYSDCYKPDYMNGEATLYTQDEVSDVLAGMGITHCVAGLSYPIEGEDNMDFESLHIIQNTLTQSGITKDCRYWVFWG